MPHETPILKYYEDEACTRPLHLLTPGEVELGEAKTWTVYVRNDGERTAHDLTGKSLHGHLKISWKTCDLTLKESAPLELTVNSEGIDEDLFTKVHWDYYYYPFSER